MFVTQICIPTQERGNEELLAYYNVLRPVGATLVVAQNDDALHCVSTVGTIVYLFNLVPTLLRGNAYNTCSTSLLPLFGEKLHQRYDHERMREFECGLLIAYIKRKTCIHRRA